MSKLCALIPLAGPTFPEPAAALRPLAGRPLLEWALGAAKDSGLFDEIWAYVDHPAVGEAAARAGTRLHWRAEEPGPVRLDLEAAAVDFAAMQRSFEALCVIEATNPLTRPEDILAAWQLLQESGADCVVTATRRPRRAWTIPRRNAPTPTHPVGEATEHLTPNGAFTFTRRETLLSEQNRIGGSVMVLEMPRRTAFELEDEEDWPVLEALVREFAWKRRLVDLLPERPGAVIFDFDGVLTDNRVIVTEDGLERVLCSRGDGMGIDLLRKRGFPVLVLSKEPNPVVSARMRKLKTECQQGVDNKLPALLEWLRLKGVAPESAIYCGNDINDLECMEAVGCAAAPSDAWEPALKAARLVLSYPGGMGAARQLCDLILERIGSPVAAPQGVR